MLKQAILCAIVLTIINAESIQQVVQNIYRKNDKGFEVLLNKVDINVEVSKDRANGFNDDVIKRVNKEIAKIQQQIAAFYERLNQTFHALEVKPTNPNIIECGQVRELHVMKIAELTTEAIDCVKQKRTDAARHLNDIDTIFSETRRDLSEIRVKSQECIYQIDGFKNATIAWYCLKKVRREGASLYSTKMSELTKVTESLSSLVEGISISLPYCSVSTGLLDIINTTAISDSLRMCYEQEKAILHNLIQVVPVL